MLFDMLNARSAFGKFKSLISLKNIDVWYQRANKCGDYIRSLTLNGKAIIQSTRKAFALGFLIDIDSFRGLALLTKIENPL